jgi:UDP-glucose 4-epimerase
MKLGCVHG